MLRTEPRGFMVPNLTWLNRAPVSTGDHKRTLLAYFDDMSDEEMASAIEDLKRMRAPRAPLQHAAAPSPQRPFGKDTVSTLTGSFGNPADASSHELGFQLELPAPNPRQELVELGFSPDQRMDVVIFPRAMRLRAHKHHFPIHEHNGSTGLKELYLEVQDGPRRGIALSVVLIDTQQCVAFELGYPNDYTVYLPLDLLTNKTLIVAQMNSLK